jgi:hypothetical protein
MQTNNRQRYVSFLNNFFAFIHVKGFNNELNNANFYILRLMLSKSAGPKVNIISGFHCI